MENLKLQLNEKVLPWLQGVWLKLKIWFIKNWFIFINSAVKPTHRFLRGWDIRHKYNNYF